MLPEHEIFFEKLYEDNFQKLKRYAAVWLDNPSQAEEVVQDTFHTALTKIEELAEHEAPEKWLFVTAKNKISNCNRMNRRYLLKFMSLDVETAEMISSGSAEEVYERQESQKSVTKKIEQTLTTEEMQLLRRVIFDRASHKEVAADLGINVWACEKRLERIRKKLEKQFPEHRKKK